MVASAINTAVNYFENDTIAEYPIFAQNVADTVPGARFQDNNLVIIPFYDNYPTVGYITIETAFNDGRVRIIVQESDHNCEVKNQKISTTNNSMVSSHIASIVEEMKQNR